MLNRFSLLSLALVFAVLLGGADGCASDPQVEGAKLYLRNGELEQAMSNLDAALESDPDNADALLLRAEVVRAQAKDERDPAARQALVDQMVSDLDRVATLAPGTDAQERLQAWAFALQQSVNVLNADDADPEVASALLRSSIQLLPDSAQGHYNLGIAQIQAGNSEGAIAPLQRSVEIDPNPTAYYYLGRSQLLSDQATDALATYEAGAAAFPEDENLRTALLDAYVRTGQTDRAITQYQEALTAAEGSEAEALLRYNYGSLLLQAERYDEALTQLQRAVELNPDNPDAQYNLGATYNNQARALGDQANETADNAEAEALVAQRDALLEQALQPLLRARALSAGSETETNVCGALFRVYAQLGRAEEAAEANACFTGEPMR